MSIEQCQKYKKELYENVEKLEKLLDENFQLTKHGISNLSEEEEKKWKNLQSSITAMYDNVFWSAQKMKQCELK